MIDSSSPMTPAVRAERSEATASAKDHLLGNNAVQFHANDFEAKATAKAAVKAAVKAVKAVK